MLVSHARTYFPVPVGFDTSLPAKHNIVSGGAKGILASARELAINLSISTPTSAEESYPFRLQVTGAANFLAVDPGEWFEPAIPENVPTPVAAKQERVHGSESRGLASVGRSSPA